MFVVHPQQTNPIEHQLCCCPPVCCSLFLVLNNWPIQHQLLNLIDISTDLNCFDSYRPNTNNNSIPKENTMIFPFFLGFLLFRFLVAQKRNTQGRSLIHYCLSHSIFHYPTSTRHTMHIHIDHSTSTRDHRKRDTETRNTTTLTFTLLKRNECPTSSADSIPSTEKMNDGWSLLLILRLNPTGWMERQRKWMNQTKISPTTATLFFRRNNPPNQHSRTHRPLFFRFSKFSHVWSVLQFSPFFGFSPSYKFHPFPNEFKQFFPFLFAFGFCKGQNFFCFFCYFAGPAKSFESAPQPLLHSHPHSQLIEADNPKWPHEN